MHPDSLCPEPDQLRSLLEGSLADRPELLAHVESCQKCQRRLGDWTTDPDGFNDRVPQPEAALIPPELRKILDALKRKPGGGGPETTAVHDGSDAAYPFLSPAHAPGPIGRFGRYDIEKVIGRGGMGIVLKGRDDSLQRAVAIKVLDPSLATNGLARRRFLREARAAAAISDDHVVTIHAVDDSGDLPYLVMQYVDGMSLQQKIDADAPLELKEILRIGMQIAQGLAAAHKQGLVHRDIKPANILLENGIQKVKITDFGLARAADDASLSTSGVVAGTPLYMSPEQARGEPIDPRTDLFSLGSVLYAMCTGRPPYRGKSTPEVLKRICDEELPPVRNVNPDVPDWLAAVIRQLHAKAPAERYQSALEVAALLETRLAELQLPPRPVPRENRRWQTAALAAVVGFAFIIGGFLWAWSRPRPAVPLRETPAIADSVTEQPQSVERPIEPPPVAKPRWVDWKTGVYDESFPGLAAAPAKLPGIARWQLETRLLRGVPWMVAWNPKKDQVAVIGEDPAIRIYDANSFALLRVLNGHVESPNWKLIVMAWSPDGSRLASCGRDGVLRLWDSDCGAVDQTIPEWHSGLPNLAWSPDGRSIATGDLAAGGIRVWDINGKKFGRTVATSSTDFTAIAFSPDGQTIAWGTSDGTAGLVNVHAGTPGPVLNGHKASIRDIAFDADGKTLATASFDKTVRIWSADGKPGRVLAGHSVADEVVAFTPDGKHLLSRCPAEVRMWDTSRSNGTLICNVVGGHSLSLGPDGRRFALARFGGVGIWDLNGMMHSELSQTIFHSPCVTVQPGGTRCASGHFDGTARVWDVRDGAPLGVLKHHDLRLNNVAFSPDGQQLAAVPLGGSIYLWGANNGKLLKTLKAEPEVKGIAWSHDGRRFAAASTRGMVQVWNVNESAPPRVFEGVAHGGKVSVAFSPDGSKLGATFGARTFVWNADDTKPRRIVDGWVNSIEFHPDGKRMVTTGGEYGAIRDCTTGAPICELVSQKHDILTAAFSGKGRLATAGGFGTIYVWNLGTCQPQFALPCRGGSIYSIAFVGEDRIISSSLDGTVRLWDLNARQPVWTAMPINPDRSVQITPGGRLIASAPEDTDGFVYLVQTTEGGAVDLVTPRDFEAKFGAALKSATSPPVTAMDDRPVAGANIQSKSKKSDGQRLFH